MRFINVLCCCFIQTLFGAAGAVNLEQAFRRSQDTLEFEATNKVSNKTSDANQGTEPMDMYQRDRFELLSAYLDGEVTAAERRQIEQWLTTEPEVQSLYARVLKLRPLWVTMPVPAAQQSMRRTVVQVLPSFNARTKMATWAGTVLATVFFGTLSAILPPHSQSPVLTMTQALQPMAKHDPNACFKYAGCGNSQITFTGRRNIR